MCTLKMFCDLVHITKNCNLFWILCGLLLLLLYSYFRFQLRCLFGMWNFEKSLFTFVQNKVFLIISLKYNIYEFVSKNSCNNINVSFCVLLKKKRTQFDFMLTNVLVVKQTTTILLFDRGLISPITPPLFS